MKRSGFIERKTRIKRGKRLRPIGKHWKTKPAVLKFDDGREICNRTTAEGRKLYESNIEKMWHRQDGYCCFRNYDFCPGELRIEEATFEHENKRTRARQDDRIEIEKDGKLVRINGAAHYRCNGIAGSRPLPIWHGEIGRGA